MKNKKKDLGVNFRNFENYTTLTGVENEKLKSKKS